MEEKGAIDLLNKLLPLDKAIRYLVVTAGRGKALSSMIYEKSPFLFSWISRIQFSKLFNYLKCWIRSPSGTSRVIIPGSSGKSLDLFGWEAPPTTALVLLLPPTIVMHDTVLPSNFSSVLDMEELISWYAIYSHPHEDHSPRCLPGLINSTKSWKLKRILASRKCFLLAVAGSIVYSKRAGIDPGELIRYMAPERRSLLWIDPTSEEIREQLSEFLVEEEDLRFICLGEAPHSPPEPPIAVAFEQGSSAYIFLSDGAETRNGSFIPVKEILPNLSMLESEKAELFVVGGILRQHNTYPSVLQAPYVAKSLSDLGIRVEAVYLTHLPSEQFVSLSYVKRKVNELEIDGKEALLAIETLSSYGREDEPIYKLSKSLVEEKLRDWLGYKVPVYSADRLRAVPCGPLYEGVSVPDVFWRVSLEEEMAESLLDEIELEIVEELRKTVVED
ncbi:MAG: hypothetical protein DRO05_05590 [Thermoproteota archaeon]|nr:MAG: hypothetical protein DRO05_05590 [Candidatus Korarchaeota archaeon]